ncbi:MAG: FAD:protein FMN transferase [Acidimicrobiia bacterium]
MGSRVEVVVAGGDHLAGLARDRLTHLERRWSRFLPESDISRLNVAGGQPVEVDASTVVLVEHLVHAGRATDGLFDPTLLPTLVGLGYATSWDDPDRVTSLSPDARSRCDLAGVLVDPAARVVQLASGTTLDPGGLGKGLAADLIVEELLDAGARGALVSVGGDLRVGGEAVDGGSWLVSVANPNSEGGDVARVRLLAGGVATSSTLRRAWTTSGSACHHLLDPSTDRPATTGIASATVVAGTAAWAEAWTKAVMVGGTRRSFAVLDERGLAAMAVMLDGRMVANDSWKQFAA